MKRIKHNDLTHYFLRPHEQLPRAYLDSCEKFFRELKNLKLARLTAANVQSCKRQATSTKLQASSLTAPGSGDSNRIIKENKK